MRKPGSFRDAIPTMSVEELIVKMGTVDGRIEYFEVLAEMAGNVVRRTPASLRGNAEYRRALELLAKFEAELSLSRRNGH